MPPGSVTVFVWYGGSDTPSSLKVWVDQSCLKKVTESIPKKYEGYDVVIEERPKIFALH